MGLLGGFASPQEAQRQELWDKLRRYVDSTAHPWMLAGDFNETVSMYERHNCEDLSRRCDNFLHWINNHGLIELGFSGPQFI